MSNWERNINSQTTVQAVPTTDNFAKLGATLIRGITESESTESAGNNPLLHRKTMCLQISEVGQNYDICLQWTVWGIILQCMLTFPSK